jgi:hypothetical protein
VARISVRSSILSDDEVRDIGTADNSEPPVLGRGQDVITASLVPGSYRYRVSSLAPS